MAFPTYQKSVKRLLFLAIVTAATCAWSQPLTDIEKKFQDFAIQNLQEKIYAHLNRQDLIVGEILWFKIYYGDAEHHLPLDLSRIAYVEILDTENKPVLQTKISIEHGEGAGSFYIPATLPTGSYQFRAYTKWMRNAPANYFFNRQITITNTLKADEPEEFTTNAKSLEVRFFPEGGYLVNELLNRVGFTISDADGKSVDCAGALVNQLNDTIVKFSTTKFGIGSFSFTPHPNQQYRAIIKDKPGRAVSFSLPEIKSSGFGLIASEEASGENLTVRVSNIEKTFSVMLLVHTRQSIKEMIAKTTSNGSIDFVVNKNKLGEGVSHITILNEKGLPVCERLYFKKPKQFFNVITATNQLEYSVRRKVQLSIDNDQHQNASLSVSVFRKDSLILNENIASYFYLTSDLAGIVESPSYYFSDEPAASIAADNLMLTQGWRRFKWDDVISVSKPVVHYLPELNGQLIEGKIVNGNGEPIQGKMAYLTNPGKKIRLYVSKSDSSGKVRFQMKNLEQAKKIIAQTDTQLDSLYHLEIEKPFSNEYLKWEGPSLIFTPAMADELLNRSISMQVQDAFYEDEIYFNFKKLESDTIPFYGKADETYWLDDYTRFPVLEEVLREYVRGVWVRKKGDQFRFMVLDKGKVDKTEVFHENPLTIIDGVPVFDVNRVLEVDPLKIKKLEVLTRKYFLGPLFFNGIISFSTYNGDLNGFQLDPRTVTLDYEGLQSQREFFSPLYTSPELRGSRLPDQRHQLYWNPNVKLEQGKTAPIEFYTSDVEGNFFVVVEGLSTTGKPGFTVTSFKVSQ